MNSRREDPNFVRLASAAAKLEPLLDQIAFVGGCVTGLLLTDPAAAPIRPTHDVDAIIEITSYFDFTMLENRLQHLGFRHSLADDAPICRWLIDDLILDLMPVDPAILGFSNRWYRPGLQESKTIQVGGRAIKILTAPYFVATKLEAFRGRGKNDFSSHDLEDVVTVLDGRVEFTDEVRRSPQDLNAYLSDQFRALLSSRDFLDSLPGHLMPDRASQQRLGLIVNRMQSLIIES